jgi:hypothetical protein
MGDSYFSIGHAALAWLGRLRCMKLCFEFLCPSPFESLHDVTRQVRSIHDVVPPARPPLRSRKRKSTNGSAGPSQRPGTPLVTNKPCRSIGTTKRRRTCQRGIRRPVSHGRRRQTVPLGYCTPPELSRSSGGEVISARRARRSRSSRSLPGGSREAFSLTTRAKDAMRSRRGRICLKPRFMMLVRSFA